MYSVEEAKSETDYCYCRYLTNLENSNLIVPDGMIVKETNSTKYKVGDGVSLYANLPETTGEPGVAGKSAFQVAQDNGFVGTVQEWLVSLKGEPGQPGIQGKGFEIKKVYSSVDEMNADYSGTDVAQGEFVVIEHEDSVEHEDNSKLYIKGVSAYAFVTDMSGAQGIQGPTGRVPLLRKSADGNMLEVSYNGVIYEELILLSEISGDDGAQGNPGITPHIDSTSGNWFIGSTDTGVNAGGSAATITGFTSMTLAELAAIQN